MRHLNKVNLYCILVAILALLAAGSTASAADRWAAVIAPDNSLSFVLVRNETPVCHLGLAGWGPSWAWVGLQSQDKASGDTLVTSVPFVVDKARNEVIDVKLTVRSSGPRQVSFRYDLSASRDVPLTLLAATLGVESAFAQGQFVLTHVEGPQSTLNLPLGIGMRPATTKAVLSLKKAGDIGIAFDPPVAIAYDKDLRILLASDVFKRGSRSLTVTLTFPTQAALLARQEDIDRLTRTMAGPEWFAFRPASEPVPSVISMDDWLEKPAGQHGGVRMAGDRFQFEDGTPIKFWGVNLSYGGACAPEKKVADLTAARFAKYGINGVRLHKFSYPKNHMGIGDPNDATRMDPEGLDRLDYFIAALKKRGIYAGWSHTYGFEVCPGNRQRLLAYDEIAKKLDSKTYAFINFAEDVQDLMIDMVVNLLKHKNPYTGLTYAEEPALSYIEMQNEDDIFFYTSTNAFNACPTYKKLFMRRFADWLKTRYGSQAKLKQAWQTALKAQESLAAGNIEPQTNPWFFGDDFLPGQKDGQRQRLLDTAAFLHEAQNRFYDKFAKALRGAGYKGPLVGSPWQAPSMLPHYYNLRSDYLAGAIDRHNYFGGNLSDSMLAHPGCGYFSSGLQQVIDRPFSLSEWIHVYPSLYSAEGPAIIAAYGLGLQGWDASYQFQSQAQPRVFDETAGWMPWGVWEADVPTQLGQYPALARMIYRGDVKESPVISVRRVSLPELTEGRFSFKDTIVQNGDVKSFGGSVPEEALAAGRVVVEFTEKPQASQLPDLARYIRGSQIVSSTGQLTWNTAGRGRFMVNTPGTRAVVGFAEGQKLVLGNVTIRPACPYASIFLTALDRQSTLEDAKSALLTAVARNANTGFKYSTIDARVLNNGKGPIMLEPVKAAIAVSSRTIDAVNILDQDGQRTGKTLPVKNGQFTIDGARDRTLYYEVIFK